MLETAQALLAWIAAHPGGSLVLLFFASMFDALFIVGAFVPASIVLFGMGALIALGSLELWPTTLIAAAGALAGDAISFGVGRRYGERLFEAGWLKRYPDFIASGRAFFLRHGGKGVALARFLGPVRSITPAIAGASQMSVVLFLAVDLLAAVAWALVYLVPGILFGASLGLAAEVATRLAGLLVLSLALLLGGVWMMRAALALFSVRVERGVRGLLEWSRSHRRLGRFGPALADPNQPETPALLTLAVGLLLVAALWLLAFSLVLSPQFPSSIDALVQQSLFDLSTPWGTAVAQGVARLGEWPVYLSTAAAVLSVLLWRRRLRAAAHWVAALMFALAVTALLTFLPLLPVPVVFFSYLAETHAPPRDLVFPTVIYGYAATIFATQRPERVRLIAYGVSITLVLLIGLSRLVLAQEWISLVAFALMVGLLWIGVLTLGYRQHGPERFFARTFALPVCLTFATAAGLSWGVDRAVTVSPHAAQESRAIRLDAIPDMPVAQWWDGGWTALPVSRLDVHGRQLRPFDLQWAAPAELVESELHGAGWQEVLALHATDTLRWLTETSAIGDLPVLPQVHAGNHARMTLRLPIDAQRQRLVRLWDSGMRVSVAGRPVPVWLGSVIEQEARTYYRLFRYPVALSDEEEDGPALPPLPARTPRTTIRAVERNGHRLWLMGAPPAYTGPRTAPLPDDPVGVPLALPPRSH
ncbi:MAG: VTT domain-containing protein [Panacagrimonas sp.]